MVDNNITNTRNRINWNSEARRMDIESVSPKTSRTGIERSSVDVGNFSNDNEAGSTGGTPSVGLGPLQSLEGVVLEEKVLEVVIIDTPIIRKTLY